MKLSTMMELAKKWKRENELAFASQKETSPANSPLQINNCVTLTTYTFTCTMSTKPKWFQIHNEAPCVEELKQLCHSPPTYTRRACVPHYKKSVYAPVAADPLVLVCHTGKKFKILA